MHLLKRIGYLFTHATLFTLMAVVVPAQAGQAELDLLASYAGDWRGSGLLAGGDEPEKFTCRMSITGSRQAKIYYAGRCALVGWNLSVNGAIAYNDAARRYEAAMTSNTQFAGTAIGTIQGDTITFDLRESGISEQRGAATIGAQIVLREGKVTVDFDIEFGDSGETMKTSVPFSRQQL